MAENTIILGPPGTGKTRRLLDILDQELATGTRPDRVAFLSFTKKAVETARDRAIERFNFTKDDLPWFRTLHSLAFARLGLRRDEVMQTKHYREIGAALGLTFAGKIDLEEGLPTSRHNGDRYTFLDGFARARMLSPEQAWRLCMGDGDEDLNQFEFRRYRETLREYKASRNLVDFPDMLEYAQSPIDVDCVFIDESQDLSSRQLEYVQRVVTPNAKRVYWAGDDDQAIYQWSGADVDAFQNLPGEREILHQSHRIPRAVHKVAEGVVNRIRHRWAKDYLPKAEQGSVQYHMEPDSVDLSREGSWLLLARNIHLLPQLVQMVRAQGYTYSFRGEPAVNRGHADAILAWERWRKGAEPGEVDRERIDGLVAKKGVWPDTVWHEALTRIPPLDREWYLSVKRRGGSFFKTPRINISTIHGVKGGESSNVMLLTDMSARTYQGMTQNPDGEHRVWYVGASRAMNSLHVVQPQSRTGYDL